jgi:hypothetical protein
MSCRPVCAAGHGVPGTAPGGNANGDHGPRHTTDQLVVMGRSAWWTQLTEEGSWMVQVVDDAGEVLAISIPTTRSRP